jgi:putative heme iron utilization protein
MGLNSVIQVKTQSMIRTALSLAVLSTLSMGSVVSAQPSTLCANPDQITQIRAAFATDNPPAPHRAAASLRLPEAVVLSGLDSERAHGVAGSHFQAIWKMLESWETAVVVVMKAGHVFETHGPIQEGEPSKRSNFFNLHGHDAGMSGHLRPDLVSTIYAVSLPGKDETLRGILFYDGAGENAFGVYVPGEGDKPPDSLISSFEATQAAIQKIPSACP